MPRLSGPSGWVAQDALIVFSLFCLILASQKVNGKENFGIYIEFENTCEKSVRIWLNGEQPVGEISPGQTSRFPICTDVDCTKAWGLPKAYSYTFGAQTVEDWPCDLQGGSGEITVSATAPVRVYGYHQLDCNECPRDDRNESKQVPDILIGGPPDSNSIPALVEASPSPPNKKDDDQTAPSPPTPSLSPSPPPTPSPSPSPKRESPPPVAVVVETPSLPQQIQPPVPVEQSPPPPRVFTPDGGNLFAFGGSSNSWKHQLQASNLLPIILGAWILI